jgi:hypothetical protein
MISPNYVWYVKLHVIMHDDGRRSHGVLCC